MEELLFVHLTAPCLILFRLQQAIYVAAEPVPYLDNSDAMLLVSVQWQYTKVSI